MFDTDNCKKDFIPENGDYKDDWTDGYKKKCKPHDDECCVSINIYCDKCKKDCKFKDCDLKGDCKKDHKYHDEKCCVCINIFCDDFKM